MINQRKRSRKKSKRENLESTVETFNHGKPLACLLCIASREGLQALCLRLQFLLVSKDICHSAEEKKKRKRKKEKKKKKKEQQSHVQQASIDKLLTRRAHLKLRISTSESVTRVTEPSASFLSFSTKRHGKTQTTFQQRPPISNQQQINGKSMVVKVLSMRRNRGDGVIIVI
jgi:hypothetical protein